MKVATIDWRAASSLIAVLSRKPRSAASSAEECSMLISYC